MKINFDVFFTSSHFLKLPLLFASSVFFAPGIKSKLSSRIKSTLLFALSHFLKPDAHVAP